MSKLIALVATAVILNGERAVIQPGDWLPELTPHDERELLQSGAAENPEDTSARARAHVLAQATDAAEFQAARKRVQQEQVSTATEAATATATATAADTAPKPTTETTEASDPKPVAKAATAKRK